MEKCDKFSGTEGLLILGSYEELFFLFISYLNSLQLMCSSVFYVGFLLMLMNLSVFCWQFCIGWKIMYIQWDIFTIGLYLYRELFLLSDIYIRDYNQN